MEDTAAVLTTLVLYLPIGLLTLLQVVEAGRRWRWRSASAAPFVPPEAPVTNGNPERGGWGQTGRSCASASLSSL